MDMYRLRNIYCKIIFKMLCIVSINVKYKVLRLKIV